MSLKLTVYGGTELIKALEAMPQALQKRTVHNALRVAGEPLRRRAASLVPRGPEAPHMAEHIGMSVVTERNVARGGRDPKQDFAIKIGPTRPFFYGFFQEYGTAFHGAHPFLRPAFDAEVQTALARIGPELWNAVKAQAGSARTSGMGGRFL